MQIPIKISETMNKETAINYSYENRIVRIPAVCREKYRLKLYDFITLKSCNGELVTLQVVEAYKKDVITNPLTAFVTAEIYNHLYITNTSLQEIHPITNITLGCDPELYLVNNLTNNIVSANRFVKKYEDVGYDGLLMEIRPMPSITVKGLTTNIYNLFLKARKKINEKPEGKCISMRAASCYKNGVTAGFHLHYGLPSKLLGKHYDVVVIARLMVMVLDYYVGLLSIIAEGKEDVARRTIPYIKYGKPGEYILDNRTLEYRLPGGYLLRHPALSEGLIALGITVVEDLVNRINVCTDGFINLSEMKTLKDMKWLYPNLPTIENLYHFICNSDDAPARTQLKTIITDIRQMVGYNERSQYLETLFTILIENTKFDNNIENNWRKYTNEEQSKQMVVFSSAF